MRYRILAYLSRNMCGGMPNSVGGLKFSIKPFSPGLGFTLWLPIIDHTRTGLSHGLFSHYLYHHLSYLCKVFPPPFAGLTGLRCLLGILLAHASRAPAAAANAYCVRCILKRAAGFATLALPAAAGAFSDVPTLWRWRIGRRGGVAL